MALPCCITVSIGGPDSLVFASTRPGPSVADQRRACTISSSRGEPRTRRSSTLSDSARKLSTLRAYSARRVGRPPVAGRFGGADDLDAVAARRPCPAPSLRRCRPARPRGRRSPRRASSPRPSSALMQLRRRPPGNQRRRDHDVHLPCTRSCDDARLPRHPLRRHRPRVAADAFGDLPLLVVGVRHVDPLRRRATRPGPSPTAARRRPRSPRPGAWPSRSPADPATPTPMTSTRAAFTVPAAVISIGMNLPYSLAASITAL